MPKGRIWNALYANSLAFSLYKTASNWSPVSHLVNSLSHKWFKFELIFLIFWNHTYFLLFYILKYRYFPKYALFFYVPFTILFWELKVHLFMKLGYHRFKESLNICPLKFELFVSSLSNISFLFSFFFLFRVCSSKTDKRNCQPLNSL